MDPNTVTLLIQVGVPLLLLFLGWAFGRLAERRHYASLYRREDRVLDLPITSERRLWPRDREVVEVRLVRGSVVISVDYFKRFLAWLRGLFGGEMHSYSSLLDRARREAKLRMIEAYPEADFILNYRVETSTISNSSGNSLGTVEVLAYGTALRLGRPIAPPNYLEEEAQPPIEMEATVTTRDWASV